MCYMKLRYHWWGRMLSLRKYMSIIEPVKKTR
nr:MAG TPA: hypothetical protein [Caudoviricetes sp.]